MTDAPYEPGAGDLVWTDFDPRTGREQSGRRPAVVVSPRAFWRASRFLIVCPVTSRIRPFAASVVLPEGLSVAGEILTSHIRSIDTLARPVAFAGAVLPEPLLNELREKIAVLIGYRA
ncbi:MAG: type II toxin-antitoxin system PemK/MazF family toxin [Parvibaculum sp.]|uniref:type II toxin-antitoxin system PemK/MazF family toxin n=1 Tax=Parvibaculum sp. TaxID=2024848 RepID=UPI002727FD99|nr:type II toxin-antitoxin system PemK/MazF family toxin [Parvibaculum sp.]MDO8837467.1 type II toxin-antitoxin system PemK/MazF family toxin [Parvibaculum sp.]